MTFHQIERDEIRRGQVDFNGTTGRSQMAVVVVVRDNLQVFGRTATVNMDGRPVEINARAHRRRLQQRRFDPPIGDQIDFTFAHEVCHKLGLRHPVELFSLSRTTRADMLAFDRRTAATQIFRVQEDDGSSPMTLDAVARAEWKGPGYDTPNGGHGFLESLADPSVGDEFPARPSIMRADLQPGRAIIDHRTIAGLGMTMHGEGFDAEHLGLLYRPLVVRSLRVPRAGKWLWLAVAVHTGTLPDKDTHRQDLRDQRRLTVAQLLRMTPLSSFGG